VIVLKPLYARTPYCADKATTLGVWVRRVVLSVVNQRIILE
jgi:hypothetical protein